MNNDIEICKTIIRLDALQRSLAPRIGATNQEEVCNFLKVKK